LIPQIERPLAGLALAIVRSKKGKTGTIRVSVKSPGLKDSSVEVSGKPMITERNFDLNEKIK
jgi:hypothetical protein